MTFNNGYYRKQRAAGQEIGVSNRQSEELRVEMPIAGTA